METVSYPANGNQTIALQISGNLKVRGWDQAEIMAEASSKETLKFSEEDGRIAIRSWGNTSLRVPASSPIEISSTEGNANLAELQGVLRIAKIGGNLKLRQIANVEIEKVYGNATIREAAGDVKLGEVYGNLSVSEVAGRVTANRAIKGNMVLSWIRGAAVKAMGNTTLSIQAVEAEDYQIEASGNIHCYLAPNSNANISARSSACSIRLDLPGRIERLRETDYKFQFGEGGATILLTSRGYVHVALREPEAELAGEGGYAAEFEELDEVSEEINHLIERQMEALEKQLSEKLSHIDAGATADLHTDIDEIVDQARQFSTLAALEAQSQAESAAQKAQAKLLIKLKNAKSRAGDKKTQSSPEGRRRRWPGVTSSSPGRGRPDEVSDEERLMVLKLVEENKISIEEAEQLLAALEGGAA
ncbi:MAG TPA: hypothetical protein VJ768_02050 [Anaerolineales bacterium]|nr:hypothetical protein [Anaerolineales bacterium]